MIRCIECLQINESVESLCNNCGSDNLVYKKGVFYYNRGQRYYINEWYAKMVPFSFFSDGSYCYNINNHNYKYIEEILNKNIKRSTFFGLIFPLMIFFVSSITSFLLPFLLKSRINYNQKIIIYFFGCIFFLFSVILFYLIFKKKEKNLFIRNNRGQYQYKRLSPEKLQELKNILKHHGGINDEKNN